MESFLNPFAARAIEHVATILGLSPALFAVSAPPRPELGDFAVGCFPAARAQRMAPPAIAAQVAAAFEPDEHLSEATAAGPFVNFRARRPALYRYLFEATLGGGDLVSRAHGEGKTICIDYSSPNISKHLAYHHIRSTVIGHALASLYRATGYRVIGINHLGDWGTTHGMLLAAYHRWHDDVPEAPSITDLNGLYVRFREAMKHDPALEEEGRVWFKRLEDGDPEARRLWQLFRDVSLAEFQEVYDALGIRFEEIRGESDYLDDVPRVLELLGDRGLLAESDGALVVPPPAGAGEGTPPMLLRKKDGATLYGTRDLAAAMYRWETYQFERSLYVVDRGQALHFQQLFDALARAGMTWAERCAHVPFGLVRLGGKKTGTRTANVVLLKEVLEEAERRAVKVVEENNERSGVTMSAAEVADIARAVGVGAVVFANLASQREKDVDFEWEQILSTTGDSGPYVQYAHARCMSILRKAGAREDELAAAADPAVLDSELEWAVARKLVELGEVVHRAAHAHEPHVLARYLLEVCALFSRWYTAGNQDRELRVLVDDAAKSSARLALVAATRQVLCRGLGLLGLKAPAAM